MLCYVTNFAARCVSRVN